MSDDLCTGSKKSCQGRGRPRCADAEKRILGAAYGLLVEKGWDGFTIEGVASVAGVSKATVYRWWPDRHQLALDSFVARECEQDALPDTGCLCCDLEKQILKVVSFMTGRQANALRAVFVAVQERPELLPELEAHWSPMRREAIEDFVGMAVMRGQLPEGTDAGLLFQMVNGPILMNVLFGRRMEEGEVKPLIEQVLKGFGFRIGTMEPVAEGV